MADHRREADGTPANRLVVPVVLLAAAGAVMLASWRPIDGDEGYYAAAARLVAEGSRPYADFFYPQMPLLPDLYALGGRLTGFGLADLRLVSVVLLVVGLAAWAAAAAGRRRGVATAAGLLLVAANPHLLSWAVTVKTYAATGAAVAIAWWALARIGAGGGRLWWLVAGLAAGAAVCLRGLFGPWALATALAAGFVRWRDAGARTAAADLAVWLAGFALALAPAAAAWLADADLFRFNNLTYHQLRYSPHAAGAGAERWLAALKALGRSVFLQPTMLLTLVLAAVGGLSLRRRRADPWRLLAAASGAGGLAFVVTALLPDPVYEQYFTASLPWLLAPPALIGLERLLERRRAARVGAPLAAAVLLALAVVGLFGRHAGMIRRDFWTFDHLARVTEGITGRSRPGDTVLSLWSGYTAEAGRRFVPGMENHFALGVSEQLSLEEQVRYHVAGKELLLLMFTRRDPELIVLGAWNHEMDSSLEQKDLRLLLAELDRNYEVVEVLGRIKILARRAEPLPELQPLQPRDR